MIAAIVRVTIPVRIETSATGGLNAAGAAYCNAPEHRNEDPFEVMRAHPEFVSTTWQAWAMDSEGQRITREYRARRFFDTEAAAIRQARADIRSWAAWQTEHFKVGAES